MKNETIFKVVRTAVGKISIFTNKTINIRYEFDIDPDMVVELLKEIYKGLLNNDNKIKVLIDKGQRNKESVTEFVIRGDKTEISYGGKVMDEILLRREDIIRVIIDCFKESASDWAIDYAFRGVTIFYGKILKSDIIAFQNLYEASLREISDLCNKIDRILNHLAKNQGNTILSTIIFEKNSLDFTKFLGIESDSEITIKIENNQVIIFQGRPKRVSKPHYLIKLKEYQYNNPGLINMLQEAGINQETKFMRMYNAYYMLPKTKNPKFMELSRDELMSIVENDNRITENDLKGIEIVLDFNYRIEDIISDFLLNNNPMISK